MPPDSAQNLSLTGSTDSWIITNPLGHTGSAFTNTPTIVCIDCISDYLYLFDFGFSIPATASITGVEVLYERGGCNGGSYVQDTTRLAHNSAIIGSSYFTDSVPATNLTSTYGSSSDLWGATLTPAMVNSTSFGTMMNQQSFGICTFGAFNQVMTVYYTDPVGIEYSSTRSSANAYPNPSTGLFRLTQPIGNYVIYDGAGKQVLTSSKTMIDLSQLPNGYYLLKGKDFTKRLAKF